MSSFSSKNPALLFRRVSLLLLASPKMMRFQDSFFPYCQLHNTQCTWKKNTIMKQSLSVVAFIYQEVLVTFELVMIYLCLKSVLQMRSSALANGCAT